MTLKNQLTGKPLTPHKKLKHLQAWRREYRKRFSKANLLSIEGQPEDFRPFDYLFKKLGVPNMRAIPAWNNRQKRQRTRWDDVKNVKWLAVRNISTHKTGMFYSL